MKNIKKLLEKRLPKPVFQLLAKIGKWAEEYGSSAYLVGGCVRDLLLGVKNLDLDITLEANAIEFVQFLKTKIELSAKTYRKFGTATITLAGGFKIDLASARRESYAHPAALPTVFLSSINDDLGRRDFSINAMAVNINPDNFGQPLDLFNGQKDLQQAKIRVLHDNSFIDDPTRILRAIRFEQRYGFKIEPKSLKLMHNAIASGLLEKLSGARFKREFNLLLKEKQPQKVIARFNQLLNLK